MQLFTSRQTRALDALVIERTPISGYRLMCRAGQVCLDTLLARWPYAESVAVLCGAGNNGGDGYVLARLLLGKVDNLRVYSFGNAPQGDAAQARKDYLEAGGEVLSASRMVTDLAAGATVDIWIDALFGTGLSRILSDEACRLVGAINQDSAPVLAIDVPSGLDSDTGVMRSQAVCAEVTVTFITRKRGMYTADGRDCCGEVIFDDLGATPELLASIQSAVRLVDFYSLSDQLPQRRNNVHKGDFGHVLVVGGGPGMAGAARLAGEAALRTGAGKVSVAVAPENVTGVVAACPALMVHGITSSAELSGLLKCADVIAAGPGLGCDDWAQSLMTKVLELPLPTVLDADALNLLAAEYAHSEQWVLTPHPGEAARLLGTTTATVNDNRFAAAEQIVLRLGGVCVLKGSGTLICSNSGTSVCAGGNAGMATAGMGDVLTGVVAGLLAQGLSPQRAATLAVCLHAAAGDRAAGQAPCGLIATDLMKHIRWCMNRHLTAS